MKVRIKKLSEDGIIPEYQTKGSAGFDLHASKDIRLKSGQTLLIPTGLSFDIPEGYEIQIRPRSGLSLETKLRIANAPGTIDSDYKKEVMIIAENINTTSYPDDKPIIVRKGDRIAQGVIQKVEQVEFEEVKEIEQTDRGGFGSTGE
jgi:dUTP pyrophosphatase